MRVIKGPARSLYAARPEARGRSLSKEKQPPRPDAEANARSLRVWHESKGVVAR